MEPLSKALSLSMNVTHVNLSRCGLERSHAKTFLSNLPPGIKVLDLSKNDLRLEVIEVLTKEVLNDARFQLEELHLEQCNLEDAGVIHLAGFINDDENTSLRLLDLRDNGITYEGIKELAEVLEKNDTLNVLMLCWNTIGPKGGKYIAQML